MDGEEGTNFQSTAILLVPQLILQHASLSTYEPTAAIFITKIKTGNCKNSLAIWPPDWTEQYTHKPFSKQTEQSFHTNNP